MASVVTGVALPATTEITPARVFFANPNTYRSIVALSTEGMGAMRIGKILHVSPMVLGGAGPQA